MTADELRALAEEQGPGGWSVYWEEHPSGDEMYPWRWIQDADGVLLSLDPADLTERRASLIALAPDLARLCAELGEVAEVAAAFGARKRHRERAADALAKLSKLEAR